MHHGTPASGLPVRDDVPARAATVKNGPADVGLRAAAVAVPQTRSGWRNPKHPPDWPLNLERLVFPQFGQRSVSEVTSAEVLGVLAPIWHAQLGRRRDGSSTPVPLSEPNDRAPSHGCPPDQPHGEILVQRHPETAAEHTTPPPCARPSGQGPVEAASPRPTLFERRPSLMG